MKIMPFILFLVTIPFLLAVGQDVYLHFQNQDKEIRNSAVGFLWTQNSPETFTTLREMVSPEQWSLLNEYVFEQKTIIVTGVFAGLFYVLAFFLWILGSIGGGASGSTVSQARKNRKVDVILGDSKQEKYKYKRR